MPRIRSFGIPADDPERAIGFNQQVFGWQFEVIWEHDTPADREKTWRVATDSPGEPGIDGWMTRREYPSQPIGVGIEVASVEEFVARVGKSGGKVLVGVTPLPGFGCFSVCQDSEGNTFVLLEKIPVRPPAECSARTARRRRLGQLWRPKRFAARKWQ